MGYLIDDLTDDLRTCATVSPRGGAPRLPTSPQVLRTRGAGASAAARTPVVADCDLQEGLRDLWALAYLAASPHADLRQSGGVPSPRATGRPRPSRPFVLRAYRGDRASSSRRYVLVTGGDTRVKLRIVSKFLANCGRSDVEVGAGPSSRDDAPWIDGDLKPCSTYAPGRAPNPPLRNWAKAHDDATQLRPGR